MQKVHRDTQKCAYKCSYAIINGEGVCRIDGWIDVHTRSMCVFFWWCHFSQVDVYKEPITDLGKKSKKGLLTLERDENEGFITKTDNSGDPDKVAGGYVAS